MALKQKGKRVEGSVRFMCPICDTEFVARDVALPANNILLGDAKLELVVIGDEESPDGISMFVEASQECRKCRIPVKQFFPVQRGG